MSQEAETLRRQGLDVETVGEILGETGGDCPPALPVSPPRHVGQPEFPAPGIYFNMPEEEYHAIHACSASGLKKLSVSSMDYWANSPMNIEREDDNDTIAKAMGRAYHCRICEGSTAFLQRYAIALDKADFPEDRLCVTTKDIREAIDALGGKPKGTAKDALMDQLEDFDERGHYIIWDRAVAKHEVQNKGKTLLSSKLVRRIEIAAAMINGDPQLKGAFSGGHAEVSVFWYDEATGTPMKARFDYLKMNHLIDLKSFANMQGKPVQRAIDMAISNQKYFIPVVVYLEAIAAIKKLVKESGGKCVFAPLGSGYGAATPEQIKWSWEWAHQPEPEVLFVFQQTGVAPVTRGRIMGKGTTFTITDHAVQFLKRKWARCAKTYGADPWVDFEPVVRTEDESMTWAATDFGDTA